MSDEKMNRAYDLADKWIGIVLATKPELLVDVVHPVTFSGDGQKPAFNQEGIAHRARALAEFRHQLAQYLVFRGD